MKTYTILKEDNGDDRVLVTEEKVEKQVTNRVLSLKSVRNKLELLKQLKQEEKELSDIIKEYERSGK